GRGGARAAGLALSGARVRAPALRDASPSRLIDGQRRLDRRRGRRRAVERHPIHNCQYGNPDLPELSVRIGVFFEQHDRHDLAVMLTVVDPVAYLINHYGDGFDAAVGRRLEDRLDAGVGAIEALHVDAPLLLPLESCVGQLREHRLRLTNRNEALIDYLVGVVEADEAV